MANANQRHSQVSTGIQGLESMGSNNLERAFSRFRMFLQRDLRGIRELVHPTATRFVHFDRRAERSFDIWMNWIFDHLGLEPSQIRMDVNSGHLIKSTVSSTRWRAASEALVMRNAASSGTAVARLQRASRH
ncbi:hypothetical protein BN1723_004589 [Verticillium longisporum]|uniref:Uncharacterized protein n=1 Tax=Verticillium longisporum TaxID=100787 RepID=A0A0G4MZC3_VERLO|nr:hypothetical protein BN1708_005372 [Verticillium longisporum]CRK39385.1 hypothetical protein BN1723_004589 [Verticillium longisporum]